MDAILVRDNDPAFRANSGQVTLTSDFKDLGKALGMKRRSIALQLQFSYDQSSVECNEALINLGLCGAQATDLQRRVTQQTDYMGILPRLSIDFRDNALEPRLGAYFELLPQFLWGLNGDSLNHLNIKSKFNAYLPIGPKLTLATSILFWRIFRLSDADGDAQCQVRLDEYEMSNGTNSGEVFCIPVNRRFFAGGRSTIRGFQEQTLFPADQEGGAEEVSPGGMLLAAVKTELRFPIAKGVAGTVFFDVGDLFAAPESFSLDAVSQHSFGLGLRYSTPIGPLLIDAAFRMENGEPNFIPHFAAVGSF
jgi:outer membrane protein assembly factor BamA